jgi:hypothetical protein
MEKSSKHIPADQHRFIRVPVHGLDFRQQEPPSSEPRQVTPPKKVVHGYTLHARSNDRLKGPDSPVLAGPQKAPLPATE